MIRTLPLLFACAAPLGAQVSLTHLGTVDVSSTSTATNPQYIGSNPSAVAWNGTDLWVAGYNNTAAAATTAIVGVAAALSSPTYGAPFGVVAATPSGRGYSGLDLEGGMLASAHDFGLAGGTPDGISQWDLTGTNTWMRTARGSCGVAFDPGFYGTVGMGTGWTEFGAGRRALQDSATGVDLYTLANGMIVNAGSGTLWRDMDFDPLSGDIYLRRSNEVVKCERIGPNDVTNNVVLVTPPRADLVNMQNLELVRQGADTVLFWNDRQSGNGGQFLDQVVQCSRTDGTPLLIDWGGFVAAQGAGAYDFSYDASTSTLAISDFSNRAVHVFAVAVFAPYGTGCPGQGNITPMLTAAGDTRGNGAITLEVQGAAPSSLGAFLFGHFPTALPIPLPGNCPLHVDPLVFSAGLFFTAAGAPGSGTGTFTLALGTGLAGVPLTTQAVIVENGSLATVVTSNGVATELR